MANKTGLVRNHPFSHKKSSKKFNNSQKSVEPRKKIANNSKHKDKKTETIEENNSEKNK